MKRLLFALLALFLCGAVLGSCGKQKDAFYFDMINATSGKIYGIRIEYFVGGKSAGEVFCGNIDHSAVPVGNTVNREFTPRDFPKGADLSTLEADFFVIDRAGNETYAGQLQFPAAQYEMNFLIEISGDPEKGYAVLHAAEQP